MGEARRPWPRDRSGTTPDRRTGDERYRANRVAACERDGHLVGIAMSGPSRDADSTWARQLYVL